MNQGIMACALSLAFLGYAAAAGADDRLVRFEGGIGVIPVSSGVVPAGTQPLTAEAVNRNFVRGVPPPGQIWTIRELRADVRTDGSIRVDGRGLLLAGGDNIGTTAGQSVRVRLLCGAGNGTALNTDAPVLLEPDGDFRIDTVLSGTVPAQCDRPVLLILNGAGTVWFAAGIPKP
jgi:hypothetical protein